MNSKQIISLVAVLVVLLAVAYGFMAMKNGNETPSETPIEEGSAVACTMDAKMCPDGSYVGRTGPKCEFTPCPTATSSKPAVVYPADLAK